MTTQLNVCGFNFNLRTAFDSDNSTTIVEAKCETFHDNKCFELYEGSRYFDFEDESDIDILTALLQQLIEDEGI